MILSSSCSQCHIQATRLAVLFCWLSGSSHALSLSLSLPLSPSLSFQVNFFSYVALATAALPTLEKNHGSVVVVSSLTGKIPTPFTTSYSATKFALDGFFSSLRHELTMQKRNVSITLCILGLIDTDAALEKTRGKVFIAASPAAEAALAIIRGGAARLRELFYPWWLQPVHGLWVLLPNPRVLQSFYNYSGP